MTTLHRNWQPSGSAGALALRPACGAWARAALRVPLWTAVLATLCVLALLLAFRQVVLQGVQQSESRHRAVAAHADGVWRCNALRAVSQRAGCRVQLDAAYAAAALPSDDGHAAAMTVAQVEH